MAAIPALLSALEVFTGVPDKKSIADANSWLQEFRHSSDAWATCNVILQSPDGPATAKLFAAQTFRSKVTYDLYQVDPENILSLRDSLLTALERYHAGPKNLITALCLALAGLALQLPSWENPVQTMIESFGRNPATVPTLLLFIKLLPEELTMNTKIPVTDEEYQERIARILTGNSKQVLELLVMYIQAPGVTLAVQSEVFGCLQSWLTAGEISATDFADSPLFSFAFEALASPDLFDSAVNVICDLIHETQEIDDNMAVIQLVVPKVIALKPQLAKAEDEPDIMRGYARIFSEAGETYRMLLLLHTETFFPIVEAIGECSAYSDLEIVPITFSFWTRLAQMIGKKASVPPLFMKAYHSLMGVIISHLHFPTDPNSLNPQELDSFRSFRHVMGDTLKDCCFVLRTETCLMAAYQMITTALCCTDVLWQDIEAPLFAMRSMGAEVDVNDDNAVPKIMNLIPTLPAHPRVRYAALLIISRYSEWTNMHPDYIPAQLQYISAGFEDSDVEVCAAAGQALKYLCQDCKMHLVDFLPMLHTFLGSTGKKLSQDDRCQVYEAIAHVISALPLERAAESLRMFSLDILQQVHAITAKQLSTKEVLDELGNGLENLEIMLHTVKRFDEGLPAACQDSCQEAWMIFRGFFAKYASNYELSDQATRVVRHGITFFGKAARPIALSVIATMTDAFDTTAYPSFLWIAGKIIGRFGSDSDQNLLQSFQDLYERSTARVASLLQQKSLEQMPDVLEDYVQMLLQLNLTCPKIFFLSSAFSSAFHICMKALTVIHSEVLFAALTLFRDIFSLLPGATTPSSEYGLFATAIHGVMEKEGFLFTSFLIGGLVGDFPEDSMSDVVSIFRVIAYVWSSQLTSWLPPILEQLPSLAVPNQAKAQFLTDITSAISASQIDKTKYAIMSLNRASRKARSRRADGI